MPEREFSIDFVNWYAVDLGQRLGAHFSPDRVDEIVREVESHLQESVNRIVAEQSVSVEAAQRAAIQAFGEPRSVALSYLRESNVRFLGMRAFWTAIAAALVAIGCWDFEWMTRDTYFDIFGDSWQNVVAGAIGIVALIVLVLARRAAHRSLGMAILGLGAATAATLVIVLPFWIVSTDRFGQGVSRFHMARDDKSIRHTLVQLDKLDAYIDLGAQQYARAKSVADLGAEFTDFAVAEQTLGKQPYTIAAVMMGEDPSARKGFIVPQSYVLAMVRGDAYGVYGSTRDLESAKKDWADIVPLAKKSIIEDRADMNGMVRQIEDARAGRIFMFVGNLELNAVCWTLSFTILLALFECFIGLFMDRRQPWPGRALA